MNKGLAIFLAVIGLAATCAFGSNLASDNAANSVYSGGWQNGMNGGYGFGAWTQSVYSANGGVGYFYVNSYVNNPACGGPGIDTGSPGGSWGLSVSNVNSGTTFAERPFTGGPMTIGQTFQISLQNGFVDGGAVGIDLRDTTGISSYNSGELLSLYFSGGWHIYDGNGNPNLLGYDTHGFIVDFTVTGANTYSLTMTNLDPSASQSITVTGTLETQGGGEGVDSVALYSQQSKGDAYHNMYFNSMEIVPEPSTVLMVFLGMLLPFFIRRRK
jgi:hypothetical protein